jgi:dTDP-4-dehydrorhamnose reductase
MDLPFIALLYGRGWIGTMLVDLLRADGASITVGESRLENREALRKEISTSKCTHIFNTAGITGAPNVDWCEDHKVEVVRSNVIGALNIIDVCHELGVHLTNITTVNGD